MNKTGLIEHIAREAELTKATAATAVEALIGAITNSLQAGEPVIITGFGTFLVSERASRTGRNPMTGESITISAGKRVRFKASKNLKEKVKEEAVEA